MTPSQWQRCRSLFYNFMKYKNYMHLQTSLRPQSSIAIVFLLHRKSLENLLIVDFSLFYLLCLCGLLCLLYIASFCHFICVWLWVSPCLLWVISYLFLYVASYVLSVAMAVNSHKYHRSKSSSVPGTPSKKKGITLLLAVKPPKKKSATNTIYRIIAESSCLVFFGSRL